jgi:hypothetical protein
MTDLEAIAREVCCEWELVDENDPRLDRLAALITAALRKAVEGERAHIVGLFSSMDEAIADATQFGSGGAAVLGAQVQEVLDALRPTPDTPEET